MLVLPYFQYIPFCKSSPPKRRSDDAIKTDESEAFEPYRFAVKHDKCSHDCRQRKGDDEQRRQNKGQYRPAQDEREQQQDRKQPERDLKRAVKDDAARVIRLVSPGPLYSDKVFYRVSG